MSRPKPSGEHAFMPTRIVSGGQTGVDRAALDVAMALGIEHGGWCPAGRLSEDGSIPSRYELRETDSSDYRVRTEQNVIDSDATLILYEGRMKGGTLLTRRICVDLDKPFLAVRIDSGNVVAARQWLQQVQPITLNVAGPRESTALGIFGRSMEFLLQLLTRSVSATSQSAQPDR